MKQAVRARKEQKQRKQRDRKCTAELERFTKQHEDRAVAILILLGTKLDRKLHGGITVREFLMAAFLKILDKHGDSVPFVPNEAQREIGRRWGRKNIVLKARQLGITTYVAARYFIDTVTRPGALTVQVAHDQRSAEEIFRMVHRFQENLPECLREGPLKTSRANVRQIVWPKLDSQYRVETAGDPDAGRGLTIRNLHCSEVARWSRDGGEALISLRAAVPPDGQIVLESTPQGAGGLFYNEWQAAGETGFVRHFLPWWKEKAYRVPGVGAGEVNERERELMEKHGLSEEQIVYRRQMRADYRGKMAQEFAESAEECFLSSGECVFEVDCIERRLKELGEGATPLKASEDLNGAPVNASGIPHLPKEGRRGAPVNAGGIPHLPKEGRCGAPAPVRRVDSGQWTETPTGALALHGLEVYLPALPRKRYIVGVDPAGGGTDGDYACAQVIDRETGLQCAELRAHLSPAELARKVAALATKYNQALVAVERNNHGHAVLAQLSTVCGYENVYCQKGQPGFLTSAATRPAMIENLAALVSGDAELFSSPTLLRECKTFVRQADGSARAAAGSHDDTVMAMAIAQQVRKSSGQ